MRDRATAPTTLLRFQAGEAPASEADRVAVEEPLEIRVEGRSVAVVMRTPGEDRDLAAGFLFTENVIRSARDIFDMTVCVEVPDPASKGNVLDVALANPGPVDFARLTRNVFSSSSCGVCGKASIAAVRAQFQPLSNDFTVAADLLPALPARLREAQAGFRESGGLHACGLFDRSGRLLGLREDVGRHNALDKLIGHAVLEGQLPLSDRILLLSGRVSFEMMQKALAARIPVIAAVSAPTSLAVEFARENGQTLIGFLRGGSYNVYTGAERLHGAVSRASP